MRFPTLLSAVLCLLPLAPAQVDVGGVTGVVGVNDYTINGVGSGSTSCTKVTLGPGPVTFKVTAAPLSTVILLFSPCPCAPCSLFLGTSCAPTQTLDLNIFCPLISGPTVLTDASGAVSLVVPKGACTPGTFLFSTQALVVDFSCFPWPFRLTQAYDVCC